MHPDQIHSCCAHQLVITHIYAAGPSLQLLRSSAYHTQSSSWTKLAAVALIRLSSHTVMQLDQACSCCAHQLVITHSYAAGPSLQLICSRADSHSQSCT
eukprot:210390-Pelagomonas_calceolata.AAC.11